MLVKQKSNWRIQKNAKTRQQNKKAYLMPPSRHGHFHLILILHLKMVDLQQKHENTAIHWL